MNIEWNGLLAYISFLWSLFLVFMSSISCLFDYLWLLDVCCNLSKNDSLLFAVFMSLCGKRFFLGFNVRPFDEDMKEIER